MNVSTAKNIAKKFTASTFLLSLALFCVSDVLLRNQFNHAAVVNPEGTLGANLRSASKLPKCLANKQDPDVVIFGSSLMLVPTVRCDEQAQNKRARHDRWYLRNVVHQYSDALYLQRLISEKLKANVEVKDLAVSAGMQSDQYFVLQHYLASGKNPKLIVLGVAPRDFLDNNRKNPTETPVFRMLSDFTNIADVADSSAPLKVLDFAAECAVHCYKMRDSYQHTVSKLVENRLGRDNSKEDKDVAKYERPASAFKDDLAVYSAMYLPLNMKSFQYQTKYLEKFLQLAQSRNIPVMLIDMPITAENRAILPKEFLVTYNNKLNETATKYGAQLFCPENEGQFSLADYDDSVHLNADGGAKLFQQIAQTISKVDTLRPDVNRQIAVKQTAWPF